MGYTHYWSTERNFTESEWYNAKCLASRMLKLLEKDVKLANQFGETDTSPIISNDCIGFNGIKDEGHESFCIEKRKADFEFCKTARKPYDLAVCVFLYCFWVKFPGVFSFRSDGNTEDWKEAKEWMEENLYFCFNEEDWLEKCSELRKSLKKIHS